MTRSEIREKFRFIHEGTLSDYDKPGECFVTEGLSIDKQIENLKIGKNFIFYFKVKQPTYTEDGIEERAIELTSDTVYLSPPKYM